ncbi:MAG: hypothetical protein ACE5HF_01435 [Gemmatimonadota bacterium]
MNRRRKFFTVRRASLLFVAGAALALGACAPPQEEAAEEAAAPAEGESAVPSPVGTFRLVARELPDGTRIEPPDIEGMITFTAEYRNFNIVWRDEAGNPVSTSSIARYALSDSAYTEHNLFHVTTMGDAGPVYDMSPTSASAPITVTEDGAIEFTLPLHDEPFVSFTADAFTASIEGEFTDYWERVE